MHYQNDAYQNPQLTVPSFLTEKEAEQYAKRQYTITFLLENGKTWPLDLSGNATQEKSIRELSLYFKQYVNDWYCIPDWPDGKYACQLDPNRIYAVRKRPPFLWSRDITPLRRYLAEDTLYRLAALWQSAAQAAAAGYRALDRTTYGGLELEKLLKTEFDKRREVFQESKSPSGNCFLVCARELLLLVSVFGYIELEQDYRMYEGEIFYRSIHWIESDYLLLYEKLHLGRPVASVVCHFSDDENAFLKAYPPSK